MTKLSHLSWRIALLALSLSVAQAARAELLLGQPPREVRFQLGSAQLGTGIDLLQSLRDTSIDRLGPVRLYTTGPWGQWQREPLLRLTWQTAAESETVSPSRDSGFKLLDVPSGMPEGGLELQNLADLLVVRDRAWASRYSFATQPAFDTTGFSLRTDGFDSIFRLPPTTPVLDWRCRRRPVLVSRTGGESDRFELVRCDSSMAPEALDRLSILARPADIERPIGLLPDEPDPVAWEKSREWTPGVRVLHPRLVWALQQIADAFPYKAILLFSGYRPLAEVNDSSGHKSLHASGRALDIAVHKIDNEELMRVCSKLRGIGCGFYPHNKFVHIDVRRAEPGDAIWVDSSNPGEPAKYELDYPGLIERGRLIKLAKPR